MLPPGAAASDTAWSDYGPDNYAGVTFAGLPADERTLIGWMSNWTYARNLPVIDGALGMMTVPRRLRLTRDAGGWPILAQQPVLPPLAWAELPASGGSSAAPIEGTVVLDVALVLDDGGQAAVRLRCRADGTGGVVVRVTPDEVSADRTAASGEMPEFARVSTAPRVLGGCEARLRIVLGEHSIEVFADDGTATITSRILPEPDATGLSISPERGRPTITSLRLGRP